MATKQHPSIAEQLRRAGLAISNAMGDKEITNAMESSGYDGVKLAQGKALFDSAKAAQAEKTSTERARREAVEVAKKAKLIATEAFQTLAQVAKGAFGREVLTSLCLSKPMPRSTDAFLTAGYALFDNARLPEIQAKLVPYGYDEQKLQSEREKISACARADQAHQEAKEATRKATEKLNTAVNELMGWHSEFQNSARKERDKNEQSPEKTGLVLDAESRCTVHQAPTGDKLTFEPETVTSVVTGPLNTRS